MRNRTEPNEFDSNFWIVPNRVVDCSNDVVVDFDVVVPFDDRREISWRSSVSHSII